MLALKAKPEPLEIALDQTAIVVVDMQNAFASKGGEAEARVAQPA